MLSETEGVLHARRRSRQHRLRRAEGRLRGAIATLDGGRGCADVLTQLAAVTHAPRRAGDAMLPTASSDASVSRPTATRGEHARPVRPAKKGKNIMSTTGLTAETFEKIVTGDGIVLVDWWASWCGPCRRFAPVFEQAGERHADIVFAKVDTEAEQQLAAAAGISSIPTLMAFRDGILVSSQPGALSSAALEELITAVRGLDMDEVRSKVVQQRGGGESAVA